MKIKLLFIVSLLCFVGCNKNPYHKDVSAISVDFSLQPFHTEIQALGTNPSNAKLQELRVKYGDFFDLYMHDIRQTMMLETDSSDISVAQKFVNDEWIRELYRLSDSVLGKNQKVIEKKVTNALQYYKYYFPNKSIPQFYTFITGLNCSMAIYDKGIAIGIDKYLGSNCSFYNSVNMESYIRKNLNPEKIPADLMRALAEDEFPNAFDEDYLLAKMIQCGRYQYFVKCMLPDEPDTLLWGFSAKQLEFCKKSEGEFWKMFISTDNLLFSTDRMVQKRFLDDGPFTPIFTKESPARVGQWMGFKIVESFMKNNPSVTLEDLFVITSSKEIMSKAKYNPK